MKPGPKRRITDDQVDEMKRMRHDEHLTLRAIAAQFGCSTWAVATYTSPKSTRKPSDIHARWALLLPAMIAEVKKAAGTPPTPAPYPAAAKALDRVMPPPTQPEAILFDDALEPA